MKKILFTFFMLLSCVTMVNAKEVFDLDWKTNEITLENAYTLFSDYGIRNTEYKDGYLMTKSTPEKGATLSYYDLDGNILVDDIGIGPGTILELVVKNDDIYLLLDAGEILLIKLNSDFEIEKMTDFSNQYQSGLYSMLYSEIPFFAIHLLSIDDTGKAYILTVDYDMIIVDADFESYTYEYYNEELLNKQFPELMELENYQLDDYYYYNLKKNTNNTVLSGIKPNECIYTSNECEYDSIGVITLQNTSGDELWTKEYPEYKEFINTLLIDNYIVTIGIKDLDDLAPSSIVVLDLDGNIVQTIDNENSYYYLVETTRGLLVTNYSEETTKGNDGISDLDNIKIVTEVYQLRYNINTKIEGEGMIEVIDNSLPNKNITFKITPEKGYVLSKVKVTDSKGNVVTFTDYTFTMPSADVTIEAIFTKDTKNEEKNPDTADIILISCVAIIVSGVLLTYINIKKTLKSFN